MGCVKLFEEYLPRRPYHTDDLTSGLKINKKEYNKFFIVSINTESDIINKFKWIT